MGKFSPFPTEALKTAGSVCGRPVELKEITDRRGSAVWRATGVDTAVAVKYGYGDGEETTAREAAALDQLSGYSVVTGRAAGGVWYLTPWLDGPSTWKIFGPIRDGVNSGGRQAHRAPVVAEAAELCRAVAELHAQGWVHGDLQPSHGIHTQTGVRLIDFAWSWHEGRGVAPWTEFYGGVTHLVAPELAAWITDGPQPVVPSARSDVYALAGVLWTCTTGRWPLNYAATSIRQDTGPSGRRAAIATGRIPLDPETPWPAFQDVLRPVLLCGPDDRPTAAELGNALASLP